MRATKSWCFVKELLVEKCVKKLLVTYLEDHEINVKRLGNLTLSTRNSSLKNNGFDKKRKIYKDSSWQIERDLYYKYEEWSKEQIDNRGKELVKFAKERWKV